MQKISLAVVSILIAITLGVIAAPVLAQEVKCDPLPKVEWWSQTHGKVIATVNNTYKGDWSKYIQRWVSYRTRMEKTLAAKSVAVVKSRNLRMQGKVLEDPITQIKERIKVLQCLQDTQPKTAAKTAAKTASKSEPKKKAGPRGDKVFEVREGTLNLEVVSTCDKGVAKFQVTNLGDKWPRLAAINIYRTDNKTLISRRRMKLKNSQQVTFQVSPGKAGETGDVGIWVEPSWTKRAFKYDSINSCR